MIVYVIGDFVLQSVTGYNSWEGFSGFKDIEMAIFSI
jgi:hypothetical protein